MSSHNFEEERAKRLKRQSLEGSSTGSSSRRPVRNREDDADLSYRRTRSADDIDRPRRTSESGRPVRRSDSDSVRRQGAGDSRRPVNGERSRRPVDGQTRRPADGRERRMSDGSRRPVSGDRPRRTSDDTRRSSSDTKRTTGETRRRSDVSSRQSSKKPKLEVKKPSIKERFNAYKAKKAEAKANMTREERLARLERNSKIKQIAVYAGIGIISLLILVLVVKMLSSALSSGDGLVKKAGEIPVEKKLLTIDKNTRSGQKLEKVSKIVIHNTGEQNASATKMWDYYESLGKAGSISESVHFIVDVDGNITQLIPTNEVAFHALSINQESLGIQYCYSSDNGSMSDKTREAMVELIASLCKKNKLTSADVVLHSEVTGIACPKYYVDNNNEWKSILDEVSKKLK